MAVLLHENPLVKEALEKLFKAGYLFRQELDKFEISQWAVRVDAEPEGEYGSLVFFRFFYMGDELFRIYQRVPSEMGFAIEKFDDDYQLLSTGIMYTINLNEEGPFNADVRSEDDSHD